jgi:hypothetical protein
MFVQMAQMDVLFIWCGSIPHGGRFGSGDFSELFAFPYGTFFEWMFAYRILSNLLLSAIAACRSLSKQ